MKKLPENVQPFENIYRKPCTKCGAFIYHPYASQLKRRKYCSTSCQMKGNKLREGIKPTNAWTSEDLRGEKNPRWTGNNVTYGGVHDWMTYNYGQPEKCEHCQTTESKKFEWANISKEYKRDRSDWVRLCRKCHYDYDGQVLLRYQKRKVREKMSNNKSGYKNVCQEKKSGRYYAYIATKGYRQRLGTFDTPEEAYEVYKAKALELFGKY